MSWLDGLPNWGPFRRGGTAVAEREEATTDARGISNGPPLMLLVNDASGRASFKTHVFPDAESATDFVLYWFPNQSQGGIIAFWAMTQAPDSGLDSPAETLAEAVVMIRDVTRDGVVYLFSFVDIETARTFLREEARHGTDLGVMMLYWAVPVRLTADPWGKMTLTPSVPPGAAYEVETEVSSDIWSPPQTPLALEIERLEPDDEPRDVFEEAPNAHTGVADPMGGIDDSYDLTSWVERSAKERPASRSSEEKAKARAALRRALFREAAQEAPVEEQPPATAQEVPEETGTGFEPFVPEPEAEATADAEPEARADAEPEARADAEPEATAVAEPEATAVAEPEAMAVAEPEAMADAEQEAFEAAPILHDAAAELPAIPPVAEDAVAPEEDAEDEPAAGGMETVEEHPSIELRGSITRVHTNGNGHKPTPAEEDGRGENDNGDAKPPRKVRTNGHKPTEATATEPVEEEINPTLAPTRFVERRTSQNGRRAADEPERRRTEVDPANEETAGDEKVEIRIDIHLESSENLKVKRWEVKEEPFEGFNSPPGRF